MEASMKDFAAKYSGKNIEDAGELMCAASKTCVGDLRRAMKAELERGGATLAKFSAGHYYVSGFVEKDGRLVFFSWSVPRGGWPIDVKDNSSRFGVMFRQALSTEDYTGGFNRYASLEQAPGAILALLG